MVKDWITIRKAMFLLRNTNKTDFFETEYNIKVRFNKGGLESGSWQYSYIEFAMDFAGYTIRYFPRRYIRDYTLLGQAHKTYFEGWYIFQDGEYDTYQANKEDINLCKKILKKLKAC